MSKRHESEAYADIQPPAFFNESKKRKPRRVKKDEAKEKFAAMHTAVDLARHMEALRR